MSTSKKSQSNIAIVPGGWSPWSFEISAEQKDVLHKGTQVVIGGSFNPIAVATQVVAGTNFSFVCEVTAWKMHYVRYIALVQIHRGLDGEIQLMEFTPIGAYPGQESGYSFWNFSLPKSVEELFDATPGLSWNRLRMGYKPLSYTTKAVNGGTDYVFLAEQVFTMGGRIVSTTPYFIYIFDPKNGGQPILERKELIKPSDIPHLALLEA